MLAVVSKQNNEKHPWRRSTSVMMMMNRWKRVHVVFLEMNSWNQSWLSLS